MKPKIAGQPYNFQWTGRFFNSLNIRILTVSGELEVQIDSVDPKANILRSEYYDLLGLQGKNQTEVIRFLKKNIIKFSCQDSKSSTKLDTKVFCREIYIKNKKNSWK